MKNYQSLTEALDDLKTRGYEADFATETTCLYCGDLDMRLNPEEFHIDEVYRFEDDDSSPDGSAVLYAISSSTGVRGILVDGYGVYAEHLSYEMIRKMNTHPVLTH